MRNNLIEVSDSLTLDSQTQRVFVTGDLFILSLDQESGFIQGIWDAAIAILPTRDPLDVEGFDPLVDGFPYLLVSMEPEISFEFTPTGRMLYTISNDPPVTPDQDAVL